MTKCKKCGGMNCTCKKSIHEYARANPNKSYNTLEQMKKNEDLSYESNGEVVIDDTNECESCQ